MLLLNVLVRWNTSKAIETFGIKRSIFTPIPEYAFIPETQLAQKLECAV